MATRIEFLLGTAISARFGRVIRWDLKAEKIVGDELVASFLAERRGGRTRPS